MKKTLPGNIIAWVDVDSVLVDFYSYFHAHLAEFGVKLPSTYIPDSWTYDGLLGNHKFSDVFDSMPPDWTSKLIAYEGASQFLKNLHEAGCYVVLVTHVPESQKNHRINSLISQGVYFDEIYFPFGSPKSSIVKALLPRFKTVGGSKIKNIFVDDYMVNVVDMAKLQELDRCFSLNYPFNKIHIPTEKSLMEKIDVTSNSPVELYLSVTKYVNETNKNK
jgi:hypothetical protein